VISICYWGKVLKGKGFILQWYQTNGNPSFIESRQIRGVKASFYACRCLWKEREAVV